MPDSPARYRLVIFDPIEDPLSLRDPIAETTGLHPTDVVQWLARAPGVWPHPLDEPTVRKMLDRLFDARIAAEAWRVDQFPELGSPRTIHRAACLEQGLRIDGLRGEPTHWVPWDRIELICAGRIAAEDEFRETSAPRWPSNLVTGIRALALRKPRPVIRAARASRIPRDPAGEVLVVRRDPRVTFRFVEGQMNYTYLGDRLRKTAAENFPLFLADLCDRAREAYLTPSTRAWTEGKDPSGYEFPTSQALMEYATHRLLWSWYRRDREAAGTEGDEEQP
ncbi:hypothetical protein [Aquisphaera insulae]|uniref:hypothetical protein n=1 Tax=Aquisphaera insulae TaxID=2712864 RepID=UPI0013ECFDDA|nr:hypothetical protein [Aquisphaera insulae]